MKPLFLIKSKINILILIIIITVLSAGIISIFNVKSLNRTFSSIINTDIPELELISGINLNISNARTEIYRYVAGYEPSSYLVIYSFTDILNKFEKLNKTELPEDIEESVKQIDQKIRNIIKLAENLQLSIKNKNFLKKAEYSSNLLMQSSMLISMSEALGKKVSEYLLDQQIKSKTKLIKTNIIFTVSLFVFLMLLLIFGAVQKRILSKIVISRTKTLKSQLDELHAARNNLIKSEKRFANLYNNAPVSYFTLDESGKITDVNNKWLKIMSYEKESVINSPFENFVFSEDKEIFNIIFKDLVDNQNLQNKELRLVNSDNGVFNILITGSLDIGTGNYHCVFYDITDKKQLETQLMHSEKMSAIGQLAGGIAHDFNNQLAGITGYAELLKMGSQNPKTAKFADNILTISGRSSELVKQLLIFSRKGQPVKTKIDIHPILNETEMLIKRSIDKKISLKILLNAEDSVIKGDPGQISNLFLNLAINSRDAMPKGGEIIISTESVLIDSAMQLNSQEMPDGYYIKIKVEDTGPGIPEDIKKRIFEPFFTTKPTGKGTGMGLSLAYSTVKNHNGFIDFQNKEGGGTVFYVFFPLIFSAVEKEDAEVVQKRETVCMADKILVVDDEDILREMVTETLAEEGYKTIEAEDGEQALRIFKDNWKEISLVLLDLVMPKVNGYDAFIRMKSINPDVKVIITTGYSFNNDIPELEKQGVRAVVMKPYKISSLLDTISKELAEAE